MKTISYVIVALFVLCACIEAASEERCILVCMRKFPLKQCKTACKIKIAKPAREMVPQVEVFADSDAGDQPVSSEALWKMYRQELIKALTFNRNDRPNLQILQVTEDAVWDEDRSLLDRFADYVPYWGEYYTRTPYQISKQYSTFLNEISMGDKIKDQGAYNDLENERRNYRDLSNQLNAKRTQCIISVSRSKPSSTDAFNAGVKNCLKDMTAKIESCQVNMDWYTLLAYENANNDLISSLKQVEKGATYRESGNKLENFRAGRGGQSIHVNIERQNYQERQSTWDQVASKGIPLPAGLKNPFFTSPESKMPALVTTLNQIKIQINIPAFTIVQISPGDWFRKSLIQGYRHHKYINDHSIGERLFGNGGSMKLMPKALFVVKNPSMTLTMDRRDEAVFNEQTAKSSGGFFSKSSSSTKVTKTYTNNNMVQITISANSDVPQVIAVDNEVLP